MYDRSSLRRKISKKRTIRGVMACDYNTLIKSTLVDVVYIPIPCALRLPWAVKAIENKKHIIVEKPLGSPWSGHILMGSCRAKNVQFMDGIQFMHHKRFKDLTEKIHKKKIIGNVLKVNSSFSVPCLDDKNIRNEPKLEPLGVLGDLGVHNIRLSLWAFDYEPPLYVKAVCHKRSLSKGALQDISCWLFFSNDRVDSFDASYHCPLRQNAEIVGETGTVEIRQFVLPNENRSDYSMHYSTLNSYDTQEMVVKEEFLNEIQEVNLVNRVSRIVQNNQIESFWPQITLMTEKVLDAARRSIDKSGKLVEFVKGQIWFEMSKRERRLSVLGTNRAYKDMTHLKENYHQLVQKYSHEI